MVEVAIQRLEATVQQWTERLPQDSRTSSRPPSSHPPQVQGRRPQGGPRGRQPGGQPRAWLWTAVTAGVTVLVVRLSRGAKVAQERWGERFWG